MAVERLLAGMLLEWLREDAPYGDLTVEALGLGSVCTVMEVVAKSRGVAACTEELAGALRMLGLEAEAVIRGGEWFEPGAVLLRARGAAGELLALERVILNLLVYASGVATETRRMVEAARGVDPRVRVAATRKTPPGLRLCAKLAFRAGGGDTHRLGLSDALIIKDSHVEIVGSLEEAVRRALAGKSFIHRLEVEVSTPPDAVRAAELGADVVMLDNMSPGEVREALKLLEERGLRGRVMVEASGGVTPENIADYAATGVDVVSTSYPLLHPARVDLSARHRRVKCKGG